MRQRGGVGSSAPARLFSRSVTAIMRRNASLTSRKPISFSSLCRAVSSIEISSCAKMCIRDRSMRCCSAAACVLFPRRLCSMTAVHRSIPSLRQRYGRSATPRPIRISDVSYTHLADASVCRSIDEVEAAELVFQCMKTSQLFGKGKTFCPATAKELYGVFGELDAACVDRIGGSDKLDEVQSCLLYTS